MAAAMARDPRPSYPKGVKFTRYVLYLDKNGIQQSTECVGGYANVPRACPVA
jgi:hypothetical protein